MSREWRILPLLGLLGCAGAGAGKPISVGGSYQTAVTLIEKTCTDMGIQQHPTTVEHQPGDTLLKITHAGATYVGTLRPDGQFTGQPQTFMIGNVTYLIRLNGRFTAQAVDIRADVEAGRQPPCGISARWSGPKDGGPNVIP